MCEILRQSFAKKIAKAESSLRDYHLTHLHELMSTKYKYSFFPRTLLDWNTVCWSPSQVLVCKRVSWSGRL